ncbi:MAG TPA: DNA-3-methyladenine glycosylase [Candidatus Acidoferrum sp.]|nr:DNA-3-methyladenine glycosylase [Candidatus Acidoferrum sp.]
MTRTPFKLRRLTRKELPSDTLELARFVIGKVIVHDLPEGRLSGRIVEAEGYPPGDPAGHHFRGETKRNHSLFLRHGHVYVYFNYGMHFMLNISSERAGVGGGVLIRALEPLEGIEFMQRHRKSTELRELTRGPGRLAAALRIDRTLDGLDLFSRGPLWLGARVPPKSARRAATEESPVGVTVRIGITHAAEKQFRFYEPGNPFVSGPKRLLLSS